MNIGRDSGGTYSVNGSIRRDFPQEMGHRVRLLWDFGVDANVFFFEEYGRVFIVFFEIFDGPQTEGIELSGGVRTDAVNLGTGST